MTKDQMIGLRWVPMSATKGDEGRATRFWSFGQPDDISLRRVSGPSEAPKAADVIKETHR